MEKIEISSLDVRYEGYRMKSAKAESILLSSIAQNGIKEPLQGIDAETCRILLDGFKRYRCAKKLGIGIVPYNSLGSDPAIGIINLIRVSNAKSLTILEQARLIEELRSLYKMSVSEIAGHLEKSKGWVGMRVGIIGEISDFVMQKILKDQFPMYAYMYTIRPFMRMNGKKDVEDFIRSVSGKGLSIRDIEQLAHGYFKGSNAFREQIKEGNISWALSRMKDTVSEANECTEFERAMLRDLEIVGKYMKRITYKSKDKRLKTNSFFAQANLLTGGVLSQLNHFRETIKEFHDRTGKT